MTRFGKKYGTILFIQLVPILDLEELGLMGELERTFCIPIQQTEVINCVGYCFTSKNTSQHTGFAMLHCTLD